MEARLTGISWQETLRYLGYPGGPLPDDVLEQLETSEQELFRFAVPRVVWRLLTAMLTVHSPERILHRQGRTSANS